MKLFVGSRARPVSEADNLIVSSVDQFSRKCEICSISQPYRPPRPVTGIAFLSFLRLNRALYEHFLLPYFIEETIF
jgi:hypothetical protein